MGCDIHVHIEVKKDNVWHHFGAPDVTRDYDLFGVMAGEGLEYLRYKDRVRPVAKVHVLPEDISLVTRICYEQDKDMGIHNVSVLTAEDLTELQAQLYELFPWVYSTGFDKLNLEFSIFKTHINEGTLARHHGWDDLRIICWFSD